MKRYNRRNLNETLELERNLFAAVAVKERSRLRKIIRPGIHKFLLRHLYRNTHEGALHKVLLFSSDHMNVVLPEAVSEQLYTYGFFEEEVSLYALEHVQPGNTVFDIGAHFGYFSLLFSRLVGAGGRVYAFEPTPSTFSILRMNVAGRNNVDTLNVAVGPTAGTATIKDYGLRHCAFNTISERSRIPQRNRDSEGTVAVQMLTIDQHVARSQSPPDFIKVDTENFEPQVIAGGLETIRSFHPKIVLEAGSETFLQAAQMLAPFGYQPFVTEGVGPIYPWPRSLSDANTLYRNVLFATTAV